MLLHLLKLTYGLSLELVPSASFHLLILVNLFPKLSHSLSHVLLSERIDIIIGFKVLLHAFEVCHLR